MQSNAKGSGGLKPARREIARGTARRNAAKPPKKDPLKGPEDYVLSAQVVNHYSQKPLSGAKCEVLDPSGKKIGAPTSDWQGNVKLPVPKPGSYTVRVTEIRKK